jgi:Tfp pilus assembly protein PilN
MNKLGQNIFIGVSVTIISALILWGFSLNSSIDKLQDQIHLLQNQVSENKDDIKDLQTGQETNVDDLKARVIKLETQQNCNCKIK